ncbi:MAG: CPBP family intramembrane metalloprotease [Clostridiales Family XIII bacterium]|jgi:membrane protease YdiL (CAAX protease family)|nr:CPBP family intramembrane metalloprotease [Clostridiales Family XIII bacterium]
MEKMVENRPFEPKPGSLYAREVKSQLMKVVLVVALYLVTQIIIGGVIQAVIIFSSGEFMNSILEGVSGGGMPNYNELIESSMGPVQEMLSTHVGLITIISTVAGLPVFLLLRGRRLFTTDLTRTFAPLSGMSFMKLWIIAMGAQLIFGVGTSLINMALENSGHSVTALLEQSMKMLQTPSGLLYICLIGPIAEEIIFRGAIMRSLERFGLNFSIVISSLIFGLFHIFTVQAVFAFFMGLILGYIASRYSIKWSIIAHILINSVATGLDAFGGIGSGSEGTRPFSEIANVILAIFLIGGIALLYQERWRIAEQKAVGAPIRIPGSPERVGPALWGAAFTSIPMLAYIAVTVAAGIAMILMPSFRMPF